jgi:hypothetical protein
MDNVRLGGKKVCALQVLVKLFMKVHDGWDI